MSNRWFRFVIALVAMGAAGAAGYRIFQQEQQLASAEASSRAGEYAAESAITTASELKAALHAYVAAGQGQDFWTARAGMVLDKLRVSILDVDRAASIVGVTPTGALDLSDRLAASEQRARAHVRGGRSLLAGEVIFTEARDLLDATRLQVVRARDEIAQTGDRRTAQIRRDQAVLALGAAGVMALAVLVLVPPGHAIALTAPEHPPTLAQDPTSYGETSPERSSTAEAGRTAPDAPSALVAPVAPVLALSDAAAICTDLGCVSQSHEISALLARAASVLSASGAIVWVASENRDELFPAAFAGYDERFFARIGSIDRAASNLTAAAFRDGGPRTSAGQGSAAAALAVPLLTPQGPVGVFSAELRDLSHVDPDRLALAMIFAAQLANLLGSMSAASEAVPPVQQAQA